MPKYIQPTMHIYSDTVFQIRQSTKQHQKCYHAWNHINDIPTWQRIPYQDKYGGFLQ